ncbi:hypothetical protein AB835_12925 [Candidatus Endobugula sertula]|uniref:DUF2147 domain-containing protein n=1 Tax=Candidatus Endobugula sertula TaxID=62101 RepID=A0A1D2QM73_9GAMM|nr:hypothetical protein AB835_12925 [Candidatus Endobugula sertula]
MLNRSLIKTMGLMAALIPAISFAASPVGVWKTIDDNSGQAKSLVTITDQNGVFSGTVTRIIDPTKRDSICTKCENERKSQKIEGMTILWGMKKDGKKYDDGKIIDPESGKIYSANMKLQDEGQKLEVRGYIGFSLIGRSQVWERAE